MKFLLLVDHALPVAIGSFHLWGLYLVSAEVGYGWLYLVKQRPIVSALYTLSSSALILTTLAKFYKLCAFPRTTGDVPPPDLEPPAAFRNKSIPLECASREGELPRCYKGSCKGRWKPPRTHHCSQCGVCKLEWDHHCPWVGNCISKSQSASFLHLLFLTPLTITISALPIVKPTFKHFLAAVHVAATDEGIKKNWWDWKWSWAVWGGPIGRYVRGMILGYRVLQKELATGSGKRLGDLVKEPRALLAATLVLAIFLSIFTLALGIQMVKNIARGRTTLDTLITRSSHRPKPSSSHKPLAPPPTSLTPLTAMASLQGNANEAPTKQTPYVWIPRNLFTTPEELDGIPEAFEGAAVNTRPDEVTKMYDLGNGKRNYARWRSWAYNEASNDDRWALNPSMLDRMKREILEYFRTMNVESDSDIGSVRGLEDDN